MAKKKATKKASKKKTTEPKAKVSTPKPSKKVVKKIKPTYPTLNLKTEHEIAMDFAVKAVKKFTNMVKSVVLFGSVAKKEMTKGSDIDIMIIIDDVSIRWDQELVAWYRQELEGILEGNPYKAKLHINTIKLSTWWEDLIKGEPAVLNMVRKGEVLVDDSDFFKPLKYLLLTGKIKATPEAIYTCLQRAPSHLARSKASRLMAVEGLYWSMVDAAHGALIAANEFPPSPEHIFGYLKRAFVDTGKLKMKYAVWFRDLQYLHKKIDHKEIGELKGVEVDAWTERTEEFMDVMIKLVKSLI
jgi:predicted nucleotidyltransferase/uncharacterized protein (UPF0332 family)